MVKRKARHEANRVIKMAFVKNNKTGVIHSSYDYGDNVFQYMDCNQKTVASLSKVESEKLVNVSFQHFCTKCFPKGKPSSIAA